MRYTLIIFLLICFGCQNKKTHTDIEQEIFREIFSKLIDSIYIDRRLFINPPPIPDRNYTESGKLIKEDTSKYAKRLIEFEIETQKIKTDTLNLKFAIVQKLYKIDSHYISKYSDSLSIKQ